jgi:hypothetical protein
VTGWGRAAGIAWGVVSLLVLAILLAPWLLPAERLAAALPVCEAKGRGGECSFCGMTTAFLHLSRGELPEAGRFNRGSLPLYSLFWMNTLLAGALAGRYARRRVFRFTAAGSRAAVPPRREE